MPTTKFDGDSLATTHFLRKPTVTSINTSSGVVYTAAQLIGGLINRDTNGAERTDTTASAASIVAQMLSDNAGVDTDSSFQLILKNSGSFALTLAGGAGVTILGYPTVNPGRAVVVTAIATSVLSSSEAVSVYVLSNTPVNLGGAGGTLSLRSVADILAGTYDNPDGSNTTWSNQTPIVFESGSYRYHLDGKDASDYDTTDNNKSFLHVLFSSSSPLFSSTGGTLRLKVNWQNWASGRLRLRFTNANYYASSGYANYGNTFGFLLLNANTTNSMTVSWLRQDSSGTTVMDSTSIVSAARTAFSNSSSTPVLIDIERLSTNELRATLLDSDENEFSGQGTLTCNTSSTIDTNSHSIDLDDVNHVLFEEVSNSNIDLTLEKL